MLTSSSGGLPQVRNQATLHGQISAKVVVKGAETWTWLTLVQGLAAEGDRPGLP